MKATDIGAYGEQVAVAYLEKLGYKIIDRNWKTRLCEIDIIAQKGDTLYFVEVKYRSSGAYGDGFAYITPKKLKQMHFAAEMWLQSHAWDKEVSLSALSVTDGKVEFIETL